MDGHRLGLALEGQRIEGLEVEGVPREEIRSVTHECLPARGRRLEPGRGVDGVARDGVGCVLTAEMTGHDAPGVDSDVKRDAVMAVFGAPRAHEDDPERERGAPNTAMTASPTYFSTNP